MLKTEIIGGDSVEIARVEHTVSGGALLVTDSFRVNGAFKAATRAAAGTTIIVSPDGGGSICLTDLIMTAEKRGGGGTVTLRFTDGTNTINIAVADVVDTSVNFAIAFAGRWQGWRDARLEMVTDETFDATVSCGYVKVPSKESFSYNVWDAIR